MRSARCLDSVKNQSVAGLRGQFDLYLEAEKPDIPFRHQLCSASAARSQVSRDRNWCKRQTLRDPLLAQKTPSRACRLQRTTSLLRYPKICRPSNANHRRLPVIEMVRQSTPARTRSFDTPLGQTRRGRNGIQLPGSFVNEMKNHVIGFTIYDFERLRTAVYENILRDLDRAWSALRSVTDVPA